MACREKVIPCHGSVSRIFRQRYGAAKAVSEGGARLVGSTGHVTEFVSQPLRLRTTRKLWIRGVLALQEIPPFLFRKTSQDWTKSLLRAKVQANIILQPGTVAEGFVAFRGN